MQVIIKVTGNFSNNFTLYPNQLGLFTGNSSMQFELAGRKGLKPGFY